jgi:uncharacterized protein YciI
MLFFVYRIDKPGVSELRQRTRPAHLEWTATLGSRVVYAGPTLSDDGKTMIGSLWILEAADLVDAARTMDEDPYQKVDLFQSREIHPFMQVIPAN